MKDAFIIDGVRTGIGNLGGGLSDVRADDLAARVIAELMRRHPNVDPAHIADVVLGCANQAGEDNRNVARMALLLAGLPPSVPGETVNRLCASGMSAVAHAARAVKLGEGEQGLVARSGGVRHEPGLAIRQPADEGALRRRLHGPDSRKRGRAIRGVARRPGLLCAAVAAEGRERTRERPPGGGDRHSRDSAEEG
jgi:acetyl-CoA acetyltransferase